MTRYDPFTEGAPRRGRRIPGRDHGPDHDHSHGHGGHGSNRGRSFGGWGRGDWSEGGPPWAGGRRMRRGDVRLALLDALLDGPAHGYELINRLQQRTGGLWRPSAGSVYPTLQMLEELGQVTGQDDGGKRVYELTAEGRTEAEAAKQSQPWAEFPDESRRNLRAVMVQLFPAIRQVAQVGSAEQVETAIAILAETRQKLYRLLAGD